MTFYGLTKLLGSRSVSKEIKIQQYITLLRSVIIYGAETWPLRKKDERKLIVWERKVLKKIYGSMKYNISGERRIRTNNELEIIFHKPYI